jgi:hypothetical protein
MLPVRLSKSVYYPPLNANMSQKVFGAEVLVFMLVRKRFKAIYEPRTFLTPEGCVLFPLIPPLSLVFVTTIKWNAGGTDNWYIVLGSRSYDLCCDEGQFVYSGSSWFPPRVGSKLILNKSPNRTSFATHRAATLLQFSTSPPHFANVLFPP